MSEKGPVITVSKIVVDDKSRGQGIGTRAMQSIIDYADRTGKTIALSPSTSFGATSQKRLESFYGKLGFKKNSGRKADLTISESMIRTPEKAKESPPPDRTEKVGVPGQQTSLFDTDTSGQKQLFNYVPPVKKDRKKAKQSDLLDGVEGRLKEALKNKETLSPADLLTNVQPEPLPGQRKMF